MSEDLRGISSARLGRGSTAVNDMKARLSALKSVGLSDTEILEALWKRNTEAVSGNGFTYDMADV